MRLTPLLVTLALVACDETLEPAATPSDLSELEERMIALEAECEADREKVARLEARLGTAETRQASIVADQAAFDADLAVVETEVDALQSSDETASANFIALDARIGVAEAEIAARDSDVTSLQEWASSMQGVQSAQAADITRIDGSVSALAGAVATSTSTVVSIGEGLDDLTVRTTALESDVGALASANASFGTQLSYAITDVGSMATVIDGLSADMVEVSSSIALMAMQSDLDAAIDEIAGLQSGATTLTEDLATLQSTTSGEFAAHEARIDGIDSLVAAHDTMLGGHDGQIASLASTTSTLTGDLATLQSTASGEFAAHEARFDGIDLLVAAHDTTLGGHAGQIASLASTVATQGVDIDELQEAVAVLEQGGGSGSSVSFDDAYVFIGPAPEAGAWNILDLSSHVGVNPAIVVLEVDIIDDVGSGEYFFREFGAPFGVLNSNAIGGTQGYIENAGTNFLTVATDDQGRLEWYSAFGPMTDVAVRLVAHVK